MTNVPTEIREAWKDVYILFDTSFNMDGSQEAWEAYWKKALELVQKYGDDIPLLELLEAIAHMLETFVNQRKTGNKTLTWDAHEPYPHPKEGKENA